MPEQGLDGLALAAVAGQALGVTHGSGWALEEPTSTLQPGWAQKALSVPSPGVGAH